MTREAALSLSVPPELFGAIADAIAERVTTRVEDRLKTGRSPWMTTEEAIRYTRLPEGTFRKLAASGAIPSHGGRRKIFHRAEVDYALGYVQQGRPELRRVATG